jgi:hypothetical protein
MRRRQFIKLKRCFIALPARAPEGTAKDTSPLDNPSFQRILTLILLAELAFAAWLFLVWHSHATEMAMAVDLRAAHFLRTW